MTDKLPIIVVLGIDIDGRAHASRFEERDAPFVLRAAEMMGFHAVRVPPDNDELLAIAEKLPLGKIFATGRAFVPFVSRSALDQLAVLVEGGVTVEARATAGVAPVFPLADMYTTEAVNTADALWSKIEVGTVVLASQPDVALRASDSCLNDSCRAGAIAAQLSAGAAQSALPWPLPLFT